MPNHCRGARTPCMSRSSARVLGVRSDLDNLHPIALGAVEREQSKDALIQGSQLSVLVDGQPKQVGVANLLVTYQPSAKPVNRFGKADFLDPKPVEAML